jgi:hypothetical protein
MTPIPLKYYIIFGLLFLSTSLGIYISILNDKLEESEINYKTAKNNWKASEDSKYVFQQTIRDLEYSKDSDDIIVLQQAKKLGVKPKKIVQTIVIHDTLVKRDTIRLKDSIFVKGTDIDTIIGDKWISTELHLQYPNKISTKTSVKYSEVILLSSKHETINPPYKFFLWRWFQKKQDVLIADVEQLNPYVTGTTKKVTQIVK